MCRPLLPRVAAGASTLGFVSQPLWGWGTSAPLFVPQPRCVGVGTRQPWAGLRKLRGLGLVSPGLCFANLLGIEIPLLIFRYLPIPTGLRIPAQGCGPTATLGMGSIIFQPQRGCGTICRSPPIETRNVTAEFKIIPSIKLAYVRLRFLTPCLAPCLAPSRKQKN